MADQKQDTGFKLPIPGTGTKEPPGAGSGNPTSQGKAADTSTIGAPPGLPKELTTHSSRDTAIGFGVLLVLMVVFFFLKNAYANWLVGKRVPPKSANASGWSMFVLLTCLAAGGIFPLANQASFLSLIFLAPVGLLALVSLVFMVLSGRR